MREIKFRAWDTCAKKFIPWDIVFTHKEGGCSYPNDYILDTDVNEDLPYIYRFGRGILIQQYIGVKDMNSIDIYEGDIVRSPNNFSNSEVKFEKGVCYFEDVSLSEAEGFQWEVIGNIYENPELLEVSK